MIYDPNDNIHFEFPCPHCEKYHIISWGEFKGTLEIHHFLCDNKECRKHFWFRYDYDRKIEYIEEKDL